MSAVISSVCRLPVPQSSGVLVVASVVLVVASVVVVVASVVLVVASVVVVVASVVLVLASVVVVVASVVVVVASVVLVVASVVVVVASVVLVVASVVVEAMSGKESEISVHSEIKTTKQATKNIKQRFVENSMLVKVFTFLHCFVLQPLGVGAGKISSGQAYLQWKPPKKPLRPSVLCFCLLILGRGVEEKKKQVINCWGVMLRSGGP